MAGELTVSATVVVVTAAVVAGVASVVVGVVVVVAVVVVVVVVAIVVVVATVVVVVVSSVSVIIPLGKPVFRLKNSISVPMGSSTAKMSETRSVQGDCWGRRHSKRQLPSFLKETTA